MHLSACSVLQLKAPRMLVDRALAVDGEPGPDGPRLPIDEFLTGECVAARLPGMTKQQLFAHFAHAFERVVEGATAQRIEAALWERERAQSTAIGKGLAVPHATLSEATTSYLGVFTTAEAIDYRAPARAPAAKHR